MTDDYVSVTIKEYGFHSTISLGLLHLSLNYECPNPDTCSWCNRPAYVPPVLTRRQKAQRWLRNKKWELGCYLSNKANSLGYYEECDCDY